MRDEYPEKWSRLRGSKSLDLHYWKEEVAISGIKKAGISVQDACVSSKWRCLVGSWIYGSRGGLVEDLKLTVVIT